MFDGKNYSLWGMRMYTYLSALGFDILDLVVRISIVPKTPPIDPAKNKAFVNDSKARNAILSGLVSNELVKSTSCTTTKRFGIS